MVMVNQEHAISVTVRLVVLQLTLGTLTHGLFQLLLIKGSKELLFGLPIPLK
jgi:hypothetical protein